MCLCSLSMMDIMISLWQGKKYHQWARVCWKWAGLFTLAAYSDKYLKTRWQTSKRCKTVTQDLCHMHILGLPGTATVTGRKRKRNVLQSLGRLEGHGKSTGSLLGREWGENAPSQEIWVSSLQSVTTSPKQCCNSTSSQFLHGFCFFLV